MTVVLPIDDFRLLLLQFKLIVTNLRYRMRLLIVFDAKRAGAFSISGACGARLSTKHCSRFAPTLPRIEVSRSRGLYPFNATGVGPLANERLYLTRASLWPCAKGVTTRQREPAYLQYTTGARILQRSHPAATLSKIFLVKSVARPLARTSYHIL
jgi:hypothetical protein